MKVASYFRKNTRRLEVAATQTKPAYAGLRRLISPRRRTSFM